MSDDTQADNAPQREPTILHRSDWASHDQLWMGAVQGKDLVDPDPAIIVRDFFELASKGARPSEACFLRSRMTHPDCNSRSGNSVANSMNDCNGSGCQTSLHKLY
ncbi:hypothetical protein Rcae01_00846 [Novipirellula caenicola]|uniref:Uncharacterized protein n=1 Tax=Novipirellula caenicola TaxID=1536901 RepID=A0ABP9VL52_9BACT